jgi:hypothetical protein
MRKTAAVRLHRGILGALLAAATLIAFAGTGPALAAVKSSSPRPAAPAAIPIGGGFEHSDAVTGNCGTAAIGVNDLGGGKIQVRGQLISSLGTIIEGNLALYWYTRSGKPAGNGRKAYEPKGVNWTSPLTEFTVLQHREIGVIMTGYVLLEDGTTCVIENPVVNFTSS